MQTQKKFYKIKRKASPDSTKCHQKRFPVNQSREVGPRRLENLGLEEGKMGVEGRRGKKKKKKAKLLVTEKGELVVAQS